MVSYNKSEISVEDNPKTVHILGCLLDVIVRYNLSQFMNLLYALHPSRSPENAQLRLVKYCSLLHIIFLLQFNGNKVTKTF